MNKEISIEFQIHKNIVNPQYCAIGYMEKLLTKLKLTNWKKGLFPIKFCTGIRIRLNFQSK